MISALMLYARQGNEYYVGRKKETILSSKEKCFTSLLARDSPFTRWVNPSDSFFFLDYCRLQQCMLGAVLPLLAAKQRVTHPNDWMSTDAEIACPDPNCKSRLRIVRTGVRTFSHAEVTVLPLEPLGPSEAEQGEETV
jgi:uncharacterized repeat protein (TIGR04076 family)